MSKRDGKGGKKHPPQPEQWYVEPTFTAAQMFDALAPELEPGQIVWDASCGIGRMLDEAARRGFVTAGTDIVDRPGRSPRHNFARFDFLRIRDLPFRAPLGSKVALLCNPPYGKVGQLEGMGGRFVRHARRYFRETLDLAGFLVPIEFMASQDRYFELYESDPPAIVLICCQRPSMPPGDRLGDADAGKGGMADYCALIWRRERTAPGATRTIFMRPTVSGRPEPIERRKR